MCDLLYRRGRCRSPVVLRNCDGPFRAAANLGITGAAYAAAAGDPNPQLVQAIAAELGQRVQQLRPSAYRS